MPHAPPSRAVSKKCAFSSHALPAFPAPPLPSPPPLFLPFPSFQRARLERRLQKQLAEAAAEEAAGGGEGGEGGGGFPTEELAAPGETLPDLLEPSTPLASKALAALLTAEGLDTEGAVEWLRKKLTAPVKLWVRGWEGSSLFSTLTLALLPHSPAPELRLMREPYVVLSSSYLSVFVSIYPRGTRRSSGRISRSSPS